MAVTSTYKEGLPKVFPFVVEAPEYRIKELVGILIEAKDEYTNGSSFAVTSDSHKSDTRYLWLSYWSYKRLQAYGVPKEAMDVTE